MIKFSKLVVAMVAVAGIAFSAGCKSDCEKAYDNAVAKADEKNKEKASSEEGKKDFMKKCGEMTPDGQKCLSGAADEKAMGECFKKEAEAKKKDGDKKEEKK